MTLAHQAAEQFSVYLTVKRLNFRRFIVFLTTLLKSMAQFIGMFKDFSLKSSRVFSKQKKQVALTPSVLIPGALTSDFFVRTEPWLKIPFITEMPEMTEWLKKQLNICQRKECMILQEFSLWISTLSSSFFPLKKTAPTY